MTLRALLGGKAAKKRPVRRIEAKQWKLPRLEIKDALVFGGLGMIGYGMWQIYPPSALIVVGGIFFVIGLYWYMGGINGNP